jgi:protein-tyrosine phosphatase
MKPPIRGSYWVTPGQLLAGEYPGSMLKDAARLKLQALLDAGVRSFLDLTETHELVPYEPLLRTLATERNHEITYRRMSVEDLGVPTREHMMAVLEHIDDEIRSGRPVYVHCWGGIGRTGTVVGCVMVGTGLSATEALERIAELRQTTADAGRRSPETDAQRQFVSDWAAVKRWSDKRRTGGRVRKAPKP